MTNFVKRSLDCACEQFVTGLTARTIHIFKGIDEFDQFTLMKNILGKQHLILCQKYDHKISVKNDSKNCSELTSHLLMIKQIYELLMRNHKFCIRDYILHF